MQNDYLEQKLFLCSSADKKICFLKQEIDIIKQETNLKAISYDSLGIQANSDICGLDGLVAKKEQLINNKEDEIKRLELFKLKADLFINRLKEESNQAHEIFNLRYSKRLTYSHIEDICGISRGTIANRIKTIIEIAKQIL
ncbi:MAG: hypothetical protein R3Y64_09015 [Peptostreptococcaceae bacterium]